MTMLLFVLSICAIISVSVIFAATRIRKVMREAKNYERSLKMVPMLIHLPPISEDIDNESRDARDIADENISRATTLYNILSSTVQKGFKSKIYGQRHLSFEIVAHAGFVNFYVVVPIALISVVEQAITSAYPSTILEEVTDHNIFNEKGRLSGVSGGEIVLKESYAYPIGTYQEIKRDTMQSILNSLASLDNEDGATVQILLRPAHSGWVKMVKAEAAKKRKGGSRSGGMDMLRNILSAPAKPPDYSDGDSKPLSSLEQSMVDAIEDKTRSPGFEVMIRVIASSNMHHRSKSVLGNITAAFSLFDSPGRNGFKFKAAKDAEKFIAEYIMRQFPQGYSKNILNTTELATLFHFPDQKSIPTTQLERQQSKQTDGPRKMSDKGLVLGYNIFRGAKKRINLDPADRRRHVYIIGQTGTGKSVFLKNMALQDMLAGDGFCFIDPHGDAVEELLAVVPKERTEDIVYFNPSDMDYPLGLNLFQADTPDQKDFLIQEAINILYKLYDPQRQGIIGPRYEYMFRNAALALMADPEGSTFIDIPKMFNDPDFVKHKLQYVTDQTVLDFWQREFPNSQRSNESGEVTSWFVSKFGAFLSNTMMRNIIGQTKSAFNLREIMDNKKILLVNLSKGKTGELNSKLLGMIFVMQFQAAAMSRANVDAQDRPDFCLYVDEFQNYSTDSFATILSEARKYGLNLIVANQFTTQLTDEIRDAVFGNVGTIVSFRVGTQDAEALSKIFQPVFDADDLQRIPNMNMVVRTLVDGVPTQPFSMQGLPYFSTDNKKLADALKQLSSAKYGRPKSQVESEIFERLSSKAATAPESLATGRSTDISSNSKGSLQSSPYKQPSFLDDWLAKRAHAPSQSQPPSKKAEGPSIIATSKPSIINGTQPNTSDIAVQSENEKTNEVSTSKNTANNDIQIEQDQTVSENKSDATADDSPLKHDDTIVIDRQGDNHKKITES